MSEGKFLKDAGLHPAGLQPAGLQPAGLQPAGLHPAGLRPNAVVVLAGPDDPLEPLAGPSLLRRCLELLRSAGAGEIIAAAATGGKTLAAGDPATRLAGANPPVRGLVCGGGPADALRAGVAELPQGCAPIFVLPTPSALARPGTPQALLKRFETAAGERAAVLFPTFAGRRGLPALVDGRRSGELAAACDGKNDVAAALAALGEGFGATEVPAADANVLYAAGADRAETLRRAGRLDIPTPAEAEALWDIAGVERRVRAHCLGVAGVALAMARALNAHGAALDLELVESAALLHDVRKGRPGHAKAGAALLDALGFGRAAAIVAAHGDVRSADAPRVAERELVYLADKMVSGDKRVTVEKRFAEKMDRRPDSRPFNLRRLAESQALTARIEAAAGAPMARILECEGNV